MTGEPMLGLNVVPSFYQSAVYTQLYHTRPQYSSGTVVQNLPAVIFFHIGCLGACLMSVACCLLPVA